MKLKNKLRYSLYGAASRYILQVLSMVILARLLKPEQFGIVASAMVVINFAFMIFQIGGSAIVSSSAYDEVEDAFDISTQICMTISIIFIILISSFSSYLNIFLKLDSLNVLYALCIVVFFRAVVGPLEGRLASQSEFKKIARSEFFSYILGYFCISIIVGFIYNNYWAIVLGSISQSVLLYFFLLKGIKYKPKKHEPSKYYFYLKLGLGYLSSKIFNYISSQGDNMVINYFMGKDSLGLYTKAYQLMVVPTNFLGQVLNRVFIPHFKQNSPNAIYPLYLSFNFIVSIIFSLFMYNYSYYFIDFVLGKAWLDVAPILTILAACLYARIDYKLSESVIISQRKVKLLTILNAIYAILFVALCLFFIEQGLTGIARAVYISTTIYSVLMFIYSRLHEKQGTLVLLLYALAHVVFCCFAFYEYL